MVSRRSTASKSMYNKVRRELRKEGSEIELADKLVSYFINSKEDEKKKLLKKDAYLELYITGLENEYNAKKNHIDPDLKRLFTLTIASLKLVEEILSEIKALHGIKVPKKKSKRKRKGKAI